MDFVQLLTEYGWIAAIAVLGIPILINKLPGVASRLYSDRQKREQEEREERRQERKELVELVKNNTQAMTQMTGAVDNLNDTVGGLKYTLDYVKSDVQYIYLHLNLSRPSEQLVLPQSVKEKRNE